MPRGDLGIKVSCTLYLAASVCVSDRAEGQRDRRPVEFQLNATNTTRHPLARVPVNFLPAVQHAAGLQALIVSSPKFKKFDN